MSLRKTPVARILMFFSWSVPLITAAAAASGLFLQGEWLFASEIFLLLTASLILAVLLRMCANLTQMIFEMQNTMQYAYKEHSETFSSLAANVQSMRKEDLPAIIRETNARLLVGSSEAAEGVSDMTRLLSRIAEGLEALPGEIVEGVIASEAGKENVLKKIAEGLEDMREIKSSCAQVSCDTRDISSFFSLLEKHLNIKKT